MSAIKKPFVIILDDDYNGDSGQWEVVHEDESLASAKRHTHYEHVLNAYPRERYRVEKKEPKPIIHTPSATMRNAAIYQMFALPPHKKAIKKPVRAIPRKKRAAPTKKKKIAAKKAISFSPVKAHAPIFTERAVSRKKTTTRRRGKK